MSTQPAWSAAFSGDEVASVERVLPIEQITREWGEIVLDEQPHGDDFGHGTACAGIVRS